MTDQSDWTDLEKILGDLGHHSYSHRAHRVTRELYEMKIAAAHGESTAAALRVVEHIDLAIGELKALKKELTLALEPNDLLGERHPE